MESEPLFLRACRGQPTERTPIWLMRQAGRYMAEYRAVRKQVDFLTLCRTPDLVTEVTLQPIERFGFDAAILFSDIFIPVAAMGVDVEFAPGPKIAQPIRDRRAVEALRVPDPDIDLGFVAESIKQLRGELDIPLIGFGGAPFTLACYLVEGGGSRHFTAFRTLAYESPEVARALMDRLTDALVVCLRAQVAAGAQAIQLFDTWAGLLGPIDYDAWARPWVVKIFAELRDLGVPLIYFASGAGALLPQMTDIGADVISIDWRVGIDDARSILGDGAIVQGNLDPVSLLGPWEVVEERAADVLTRAKGGPHIFNLGHGILPPTPVENVERLVQYVRERTTTESAQ